MEIYVEREEKRHVLVHNLFWWRLLYDSSLHFGCSSLDVIVYDPRAIPPKKGEIVMGSLIPLGDGLYFPIIDFYHFDFDARKDIAMHLHYYYDKHLKNSTMHEAFIHVLSAMLQIERFVFIDHQGKLPSK